MINGVTICQIKENRSRGSAEKMAGLVIEAERVGRVVCHRESIAPAQLLPWKQKFLQAGIAVSKTSNAA